MHLDTILAIGPRDELPIAHLLGRGGGLRQLLAVLGTCHALERH